MTIPERPFFGIRGNIAGIRLINILRANLGRANLGRFVCTGDAVDDSALRVLTASIGAESESLQVVAHNKAMKIHLIGRLAILAVCLIALGVFCLVFGTINNNQAIRRFGSLLVVL
jgi:hypothetical protein